MKFSLGLGSEDGVRAIREVEAPTLDEAKKAYAYALLASEIEIKPGETVDQIVDA